MITAEHVQTALKHILDITDRFAEIRTLVDELDRGKILRCLQSLDAAITSLSHIMELLATREELKGEINSEFDKTWKQLREILSVLLFLESKHQLEHKVSISKAVR